MALDFEDVEREEDDLADADQGAGAGVGHRFAVLEAKDVDKGLGVVRVEEVVGVRLAAEFVHSLLISYNKRQ